jgi:hypothetical protein
MSHTDTNAATCVTTRRVMVNLLCAAVRAGWSGRPDQRLDAVQHKVQA